MSSTFGLGATSRSLIARLNQEWEQLRCEPAEWLSSPVPLDDVLLSIRPNPDDVLRELITACQNGHSLAGRVIVQALLPKLILLSRSYPYPPVDLLVSALWVRIANYPLHRRPTSVAANLVLDTKKDVVSEARATPVPPVLLADTAEPGPTAQSVLAAARRMQLATPKTLAIMEHVYIAGLSSQRVAELHAISSTAVRRRCSDTIQRLRDNRDALVARL